MLNICRKQTSFVSGYLPFLMKKKRKTKLSAVIVVVFIAAVTHQMPVQFVRFIEIIDFESIHFVYTFSVACNFVAFSAINAMILSLMHSFLIFMWFSLRRDLKISFPLSFHLIESDIISSKKSFSFLNWMFTFLLDRFVNCSPEWINKKNVFSNSLCSI